MSWWAKEVSLTFWRSDAERQIHCPEKTMKIICYKCQLQSSFTANRQDAEYIKELMQKLRDLPLTTNDLLTEPLCVNCSSPHPNTNEKQILAELQKSLSAALIYEMGKRICFDPPLENFVEKVINDFKTNHAKLLEELGCTSRASDARDLFLRSRDQIEQFSALTKSLLEHIDSYNLEISTFLPNS
ncbi:unnamed protein product, partial [Mesorhabditis spiculigera]